MPPRSRVAPVVVIAAVFFLIATGVMFWPRERVRFQVDQRAPTDLRSPVAFILDDPAQTERLRAYARQTSPAVLPLDGAAAARLIAQMQNLQVDIGDARTVGDLPPEVRARWTGLTDEALRWLHSMPPRDYNQKVEAFARFLSSVPLVDEATLQAVASRRSDFVHLVRDNLESPLSFISRYRLIPLGTEDPARQSQLRQQVAELFPRPMVEPVVQYLLQQRRPLFRYDAALTEQLAASKAAAVQPEGVRVAKNELIVPEGEVITPQAYEKLSKAQEVYDAKLGKSHPEAGWLWRLGQALTVLILTVAGALYVTKLSTPRITLRSGWALAGLLLLTLALAKIPMSAGLFHMSHLLGIAPTLLTTIILVIAFNQRFALGIACLHGLLVTLAVGQGVDFFLTMLSGVAVFTFGLREIRTRGRLIEVGMVASVALLVTVWALGMSRFMGSIWTGGELPVIDYLRLAKDSLWAAVAGVGVGFVTLGILPVVENTFKITTAMTLLELCDLNRPLLRRLAAEAPGTFNHSLVVGTLAEAAGNAIGANGLLCRAGAYYHDVGKLSKPQYFIENQSGGANRHEKLSPAMSLLIIVGHVKDGIELAREYRLPWVIHQFIAQHHGTTLVEYFFHAAKQRQAAESQARGEEAPAVSESEFRYPGPKPQTRETAILMICDGCESIVRSMSEPTAGRIEAAVHQMIMKRLMDGQFSDVDLTLRELSLIEGALVRTLVGVYHGRIAYPKPALSRPA